MRAAEVSLSQAYGHRATLAYLFTYIFFANVAVDISEMIFVKCWLGVVEAELCCQGPRWSWAEGSACPPATWLPQPPPSNTGWKMQQSEIATLLAHTKGCFYVEL